VSKPTIEPRVLKGFRDYLPQISITRTEMINKLQQVFSTFGFVPIDTPALEYADILLGKGSDETDKQLFRFQDQGGRDVALRFDLTVPLARFAAMHIHELGTPFRRYHIAPVWRAEKPQRGRYREFLQCDFDIIGSTAFLADAEILSVVHAALAGLAVAHRIRVNNRGILNGLLSSLGKQQANVAVLRAIDKMEKLGEEVVRNELEQAAGLSSTEIDQVFSFLALSRSPLRNAELLDELKSFFGSNAEALNGVSELQAVISALADSGLRDDDVRVDLSIARGLDYYTGLVFETNLLDLPEIGSICSGGRYNNLAGLYTKRELPGVGGSIGLDRILGAYEELQRLSKKTSTADVFVTILDPGSEGHCLRLANLLRQNGIPAELALEAGKLGNQIKHASKRGIQYVVIAGEQELSRSRCSVKDINQGIQEDDISIENLADYMRDKLADNAARRL
jgi:histidyl-tRNA synthetase